MAENMSLNFTSAPLPLGPIHLHGFLHLHGALSLLRCPCFTPIMGLSLSYGAEALSPVSPPLVGGFRVVCASRSAVVRVRVMVRSDFVPITKVIF